MTERVQPFANGTQYMDWYGRNCDGCVKDRIGQADLPFICPIQAALFAAAIDDDGVSAEIAKQMGYEPKRYTWACPERKASP